MEYGISRNSIIPVRREPSHRSEMVTQLLFGEHYSILSRPNEEWCEIKSELDMYPGYIATNQVNLISFEYFEEINHVEYKICLDLTSTILFGRKSLTIPIGSVVPISNNELFPMEEKMAFTGESKSFNQKRDIDFVKSMARKYLNAPYLWGGRSPFGIDCSGFIQMVFRLSGYELPRDTSYQIMKGIEVSFEEAIEGDLAFFYNKEGKMDHVGMIIDKNAVIHASGKVRIDSLTSEGIRNKETGLITHFNPILRRILP